MLIVVFARIDFDRLGRGALRALSRHELSVLDVIDHFRDVRRVIADALKVLGNEQKVRTKTDGPRVFEHIGQKLAKERIVKLVDLIVDVSNLHGACRIARRVGIEHLFGLREREASHALKPAHQLHRAFLVQNDCPLGNVLGQIAHALKVR